MGGISLVEGIGLGVVNASVLGEVTALFVVAAVEELLAAWLAKAAHAVDAATLTARMETPAPTRRTRRARVKLLAGCMVISFPTAKPIKLLPPTLRFAPWLVCSLDVLPGLKPGDSNPTYYPMRQENTVEVHGS